MRTEKTKFLYQGVREDTGDEVIRCEFGESFVVFFLDEDDGWLNVFYAESNEKGDMDRIISEMVEVSGISWVRFLSPLDGKDEKLAKEMVNRLPSKIGLDGVEKNNRPIEDAVNGYERVTDEYGDSEVDMLVVEWET